MTSGRTYESTHPWLSFRVDLKSAPPRLWMLLGEARSKIEHIAGTPLKPIVAERLHQMFLAKGVHATTAIEGNTLTEAQALQAVEGSLRLPPSQEYLGQELTNIVVACNEIVERLQVSPRTRLDPGQIKRFNGHVLAKLQLPPEVVPGEIRTHSVVVGRYRGAPTEDCAYLLDRMCQWLNGPEFASPEPDLEMPYAIINAIVAHLYFAWIHPFGDGNGRTARLIELQILLAAGVPTPAAHLLSNHYNLTRAEYYRQLARTSELGEVVPFIQYAVAGFVDGLRDQLALVKKQQLDDRWEQFIYETFGGRHTSADRRKRQLALDLTKAQRPVPRSEIGMLTPELAAAYAGKGPKALTRDLNDLVKLQLIIQSEAGYLPRSERIRAFLPLSVKSG